MESTTKQLKQSELSNQKQLPLLEVEDLQMDFKVRGSYFKALNKVSFSVNQGDFFGLIGESGSGKTTTGKCIIKLLQPTGGKIEIDKKLVSNKRLSLRTKRWLRKNVQMVFQDPMSSVNPTKNVLQIISEPLAINKSLYVQAFKKWLKLNNIARYFYTDFIKENEILKADFKHSYITLLKSKIDNLNSKLKTAYDELERETNEAVNSGDYSQFNHESIREKVLFEMDNFTEQVNETSAHIYKFLADFEKMLSGYETKYDANDYAELYLEYETTYQKYLAAKDKFTHSANGLEIDKKVKEQTETVDQIKTNFVEKYKVQNFSYIKSWKASVQSAIKTLNQELKLTKETFDHVLAHIKLMRLKATTAFVNEVEKIHFLEEETINDAIKLIENLLEAVFLKLLNPVIDAAKEFEASNIEKKNDLIEIALFNKALATLYCESLTKSRNEVRLHFETGLNLLLSKSKASLVNEFKKEEEIDWFEKQFNQGSYFLDKLRAERQNIISHYENELNNATNALNNYKSDYAQAIGVYKGGSGEFAQNKAEYLELKNKIREVKKQRDENLNIIYKGEAASELKAYIAKKEAEFKDLYSSYKQAKSESKKLLNKFLNLIYKILGASNNTFLNKTEKVWMSLFQYSSYSSVFNKEIKLRWKTLGLLEFEYKAALKEANLHHFIFKADREINWIVLPLLFSLLKKVQVYKVLEQVGLKREHAYRYPHEFSGGQRQRIVIARALINNPKIIIADEPISALDVSIQAQIINILQELSQKHKVTVLLIAHDLSMVNYACNNVIIMHRGRILEKGSVDLIYKNPIHPYTRSLMKASPKLSRVNVDLAAFDEEFTYDKEWSEKNKPAFHEINNQQNHQVYGTLDQINQWIKVAKAEGKDF